jgi:hypothetical protein
MQKDINQRLATIEARNRRVEDDKAWETSWFRRGVIAGCTFLFVGLYLIWLGVDRPWLNAVVPVGGFLLSTMAVQRAKQRWLRKRHL